MGGSLLEVSGISKSFQSRRGNVIHAVKNVSFQLNQGETLGIVGESGCGKSTLGKLIMRMHKPDAGSILYAGNDIFTCSYEQRKRLNQEIQIVFQDPLSSMNPCFRISDTVLDGLNMHRMYNKDEQKRILRYLMCKVGLSQETEDCYPYELSGGQLQRIGIARALAMNPKLVICDEVTSALDVSMQAQIVNLLIQLQRDYNLSYIFISHDLNIVHHVSDYVAVMRFGEIIEYGESSSVFNNPQHSYTSYLIESIPSFSSVGIEVNHPEPNMKHNKRN